MARFHRTTEEASEYDEVLSIEKKLSELFNSRQSGVAL
jgi:hypothetical protein